MVHMVPDVKSFNVFFEVLVHNMYGNLAERNIFEVSHQFEFVPSRIHNNKLYHCRIKPGGIMKEWWWKSTYHQMR